jgi:hypothetical protein
MIPIVAAIFSVLLSVSTPASVQSDQWNVMTVSEGQYFTVKAFEGIDTSELLRKLNYNSFSQVETFLMDGQALSKPEDLVGRDLDAIYLEVQNILGLEIPSFHGTVVICPDELAVHEEFQKIYGMDFNERSFYVVDSNKPRQYKSLACI